MRALIHAITPGDHYSASTGSAVPTVIDGLARAADSQGAAHQSVLVAQGTYPDRYDSAAAIEYRQQPGPQRLQRLADVLTGRLTGVRVFQRRSMAAMLTKQRQWPPSWILAHNLVQLVPLVDTARHRAVLYAHNDLLGSYSRAEAARALKNATLIVCVSEFLARRIRDQLPQGLRQRVVVTPNGADCQQFTPADADARAGVAAAEGRPLRVAFIGRVVADKGPDVLLRAAALVDDPDLQITVVGSTGFDAGAQLSAYEHRLRQLAAPLRARVDFRPFTDRYQLPGLLAAHDMVAVPSRWPDPCPLSVVEGQAAGLVVLGSDIGGIPETIADPGQLHTPGDPEALAAQLQRYLNDRALLTEHQHRARLHAEAHDWSASWERLAGHLHAASGVDHR